MRTQRRPEKGKRQIDATDRQVDRLVYEWGLSDLDGDDFPSSQTLFHASVFLTQRGRMMQDQPKLEEDQLCRFPS